MLASNERSLSSLKNVERGIEREKRREGQCGRSRLEVMDHSKEAISSEFEECDGRSSPSELK